MMKVLLLTTLVSSLISRTTLFSAMAAPVDGKAFAVPTEEYTRAPWTADSRRQYCWLPSVPCQGWESDERRLISLVEYMSRWPGYSLQDAVCSQATGISDRIFIIFTIQ